MNYLKVIYDAVNAAATVPVYTMAAPQGTTGDHIVVQINSVRAIEAKGGDAGHIIDATLFMHYGDIDDAQSDLDSIRPSVRTDSTYTEGFLEGIGVFYTVEENAILSADFTFILNY